MTNSNKEFESLLNRIREENKYKRINIRVRKKKYGYNVFLDYFHKNKHDYYFFSNHQILTGKIELIKEDIEFIDFVRQYRDSKERELKDNPEKFTLKFESKDSDFVEYFEEISKKKNRPQYNGALKHLRFFLKNKPILFSDLNPRFFEKFKEYLLSKMSNNTACGYLDVLRAGLNVAIKDKIIKENPMGDVRLKNQQSDIEYLSDEEITKILEVDTIDTEVKNAFLFSCFTGLRKSDMFALTFDKIRDNNLYFRQQKTNKSEFQSLSDDAIKIIEEQRKKQTKDDKVFHLNSKTDLHRRLKKILEKAKIKKSIHYHCSRHTFCVRLLNSGVQIYQVSKLMGHADLKATQIYAKFDPAEKRKEIAKVPSLIK